MNNLKLFDLKDGSFFKNLSGPGSPEKNTKRCLKWCDKEQDLSKESPLCSEVTQVGGQFLLPNSAVCFGQWIGWAFSCKAL